MLAKNKDGKQVDVPATVVEMLETQGITEFTKRRSIVKAACGLELVAPSVEEQLAGSGEWKKHARKGSKEENLYVAIPGAILPDGVTCQGIFVRAELAAGLYQELGRLLENAPE